MYTSFAEQAPTHKEISGAPRKKNVRDKQSVRVVLASLFEQQRSIDQIHDDPARKDIGTTHGM